MSTNPYAAPKAQVADETLVVRGKFDPLGHGVAAGRGGAWFAEGWSLFRQYPGTWIGMILVFGVLYIALSLIPFIGSLVSFALAPVFTAGMMVGCRAIDEGRELEFSHLFAGFRSRFGPLVAVGLTYLAGWLAIVLVVALATGMGVAVFFGGTPQAQPSDAAVGATFAIAMLVALGLMLPLVMAIWFAPALVALHEQGAIDAMKGSFTGCLRNIVPFLLYGLIGLVLAVVATLPLALGWLVLGPVLAASIYASYRDIYLL